jgi:hypothetical protein
MKLVRSCFAFIAAFALANVVHADNGFVPLADSSQSPMLDAVYKSSSLADYINVLFKVSLSVGAILAVMRIAYAGYLYMGNDMWGSKQKAKEVLGDVTLGILLLLSIFLILNQINPQLLNLDVLNNNNIQQAQSTPTS